VALAERRARDWFFKQKAKHIPGAVGTLSMEQAAKNFLADQEKESKRVFYTNKWEAIRQYFKDVDVWMVNTPLLKDLWRKRKAKGVKPATVAKDFICVRRILKTAADDGKLPTGLPRFPEVGTIEKNPRPWFTHEQWEHLLHVAQERIE